ncbi:MAG: glycosyl transferase family 8 [Desulfovibrio sp.]|jgi:hypothetical protein|nr:glycosyl transferase family 8 [Desulfovibrio sp.]
MTITATGRKRLLAVVTGVTGNFGFAAGCLLRALRRHSPGLDADVLIYTDGLLPEKDQLLLRALGAELLPFTPLEADFQEKYLKIFSPMSLATLEGLRLLSRYKTVIWLDVDTAVQDDISDLAAFGPLGMALEDPHFIEDGTSTSASINVTQNLPGLDPDESNLNSGVVVFQDTLPNPTGLYSQCLEWLARHAGFVKYFDQAALNMLAQDLRRRDASLVGLVPHDRFNAHPRNPAARHAAIVHAFGAYKLWDDGLTRCSFPEWDRDYRRWLAEGGSPWDGRVDNAEFLEGGAFFMLNRMYAAVASAQEALETLQVGLERERGLRGRLEEIVRKHG